MTTNKSKRPPFPGLTSARERGFRVLVSEQTAGRLARYSNATAEQAGYIYWQTANWLLEQKLAYYPSGSAWLALTDAGWRLAGELR